MQNIVYLLFSATMLGLISVVILLIVVHRKDTKDLRDRLMSKNFQDFSVGKTIQKATPAIRADALAAEKAIGGISDEDRAMSDRLPVN